MKLTYKSFTLACGLAPLAMVGHAWAQTGSDGAIDPVGQRPPPVEEAPEIQAIPDIGGVLTPKGRLVIEPEFQYSHASVNRLTFRGIEILNTLQIGVLAAEDVDRDTFTAAVTGRLGVTDRLELELRVPYLYRNDTVNVAVEDPQPFDLDLRDLDGNGLGDIELAAHYQINSGRNGGPFFIGNLRYKSTTGKGPFDVDYDENGLEEELATGSGFHSIEPSMTMLLPSAPAVYFANLGYLFSLEDNVDKSIGETRIDKVDPGDAVRLSFGMSYSINPRSSFTLGYKNDFIQPTDTTFSDSTGTTTQSSRSLNVGSMLLGWSYQYSDDSVFNLGMELGVTEDAPDATLTMRTPFGINVF